MSKYRVVWLTAGTAAVALAVQGIVSPLSIALIVLVIIAIGIPLSAACSRPRIRRRRTSPNKGMEAAKWERIVEERERERRREDAVPEYLAETGIDQYRI